MKGSIKDTTRLNTLLKLLKYILRSEPKAFTISMLITVIGGFIPLLTIYSLQRVIDTLSNGESIDQRSVIFWGTLFLTSLVLNKAELIFGSVIKDHMQEMLRSTIEKEIIIKAHSFSLTSFEQPHYYDTLQRAQSGLEERFFSTMTFFYRMINRLIVLLSLSLFLIQINVYIPVILIVCSVIFTSVKTKLFKERYILQKTQTAEERQLNDVSDVLMSRNAVNELKINGTGAGFVSRWVMLNQKLKNERLHLARRESKLDFVGSGGLAFTLCIVFSMGIVFLSRNMMSIGQFAAFITSVHLFHQDLESFFTESVLIVNDLRYVDDFFSFIDFPAEETSDLTPTNIFNESIVLDNVTFCYPNAQTPVIKNLTMSINPNERISLLGHNGSGKTTLIKLILGLYQPTGGSIKIGGYNMNVIKKETIYQYFGSVFQDYSKYSLSIQENIGLGNIALLNDTTKIQKAARVAGIDEYICRLPDKFKTRVGKEFQGIDLSGGQWQKVATARAYFSGAALLILDEPTSSLDPKAEVAVYEQFDSISKEKTIILVSHRLGATKLTKRIIVLDQGEIVEDGNHEQLYSQKGLYYEMFHKQAKWYK